MSSHVKLQPSDWPVSEELDKPRRDESAEMKISRYHDIKNGKKSHSVERAGEGLSSWQSNSVEERMASETLKFESDLLSNG